MKKLLLLLFSVVLISGCVAQEESVPADDVSEDVLHTFEFTDNLRNITFDYPQGWNIFDIGVDKVVVLHKDTDVLAEWENDGLILYQIIENSEEVGLKDYLDGLYEECMAIVDPEFGPVCVEMDVENWDSFEIDGYSAYLSERRGMPESGETAKDLYVVVNEDDDSYFINLRSVGTGNAMTANGDYIEGIFDVAVSTLAIE